MLSQTDGRERQRKKHGEEAEHWGAVAFVVSVYDLLYRLLVALDYIDEELDVGASIYWMMPTG